MLAKNGLILGSILFCSLSGVGNCAPADHNVVRSNMDFNEADSSCDQALALSRCCDHTITQADVSSSTFTITQPGIYCLAESLTERITLGTIRINSDDVILDLRGNSITNPIGNAVIINSGVSNVKICNGMLEGSGGIGGVVIGASSGQNFLVVIDSIDFVDNLDAIVATNTDCLTVSRCSFRGGTESQLLDQVASFSHCRVVTIENSKVLSNNTGRVNIPSMISIDSCDNVMLNRIDIIQNRLRRLDPSVEGNTNLLGISASNNICMSGVHFDSNITETGELVCLSIASSNVVSVKECSFSHNAVADVSAQSFRGIDLDNKSKEICIDTCRFNNNNFFTIGDSDVASIHMIQVGSQCTAILNSVFKNNSIGSINSGAPSAIIRLMGAKGSIVKNNKIVDNKVTDTVVMPPGGNSFAVVQIDGPGNIVSNNTIIGNVTSQRTQIIGIRSAVDKNNNLIENNTIASNVSQAPEGSVTATSFGINLASSCNGIIQNIVAEQPVGISAGSQDSVIGNSVFISATGIAYQNVSLTRDFAVNDTPVGCWTNVQV